jgi:aspartate racemase
VRILGEKIIGILGGMGPEATADLFKRIINSTSVDRDQDHFRVIIDSNAKIPDRTSAILGTGASPLPLMVKSGKILQEAGADFLIIPCNTAHYFHKQLQDVLKIPVLNMIKLSAKYTHLRNREVSLAGLLATDGTVATGLYHDAYSEKGIKIIVPDEWRQKNIMEAIYSHIKTGNLKEGRIILHGIAESLIKTGSQAIICGCTEISIVLHDRDLEVPIIDPLQVLAEEAVLFASEKQIKVDQ